MILLKQLYRRVYSSLQRDLHELLWVSVPRQQLLPLLFSVITTTSFTFWLILLSCSGAGLLTGAISTVSFENVFTSIMRCTAIIYRLRCLRTSNNPTMLSWIPSFHKILIQILMLSCEYKKYIWMYLASSSGSGIRGPIQWWTCPSIIIKDSNNFQKWFPSLQKTPFEKDSYIIDCFRLGRLRWHGISLASFINNSAVYFRKLRWIPAIRKSLIRIPILYWESKCIWMYLACSLDSWSCPFLFGDGAFIFISFQICLIIIIFIPHFIDSISPELLIRRIL